mmetsp:Transcript_9305/g.21267  ORF Transcript_9305/g.21267 Transcript_9305/m.21267 type:complete len:466 (+) Transcript_9305:83-1480(+)
MSLSLEQISDRYLHRLIAGPYPTPYVPTPEQSPKVQSPGQIEARGVGPGEIPDDEDDKGPLEVEDIPSSDEDAAVQHKFRLLTVVNKSRAEIDKDLDRVEEILKENALEVWSYNEVAGDEPGKLSVVLPIVPLGYKLSHAIAQVSCQKLDLQDLTGILQSYTWTLSPRRRARSALTARKPASLEELRPLDEHRPSPLLKPTLNDSFSPQEFVEDGRPAAPAPIAAEARSAVGQTHGGGSVTTTTFQGDKDFDDEEDDDFSETWGEGDIVVPVAEPKASDGKNFWEVAPFGLAEMQIKEFRDKFDTFDSDGSGQISIAELGQVFTLVGADHTEEELAEIVEMIDTDHNGTVDFDEFLGLMAQRLGQMQDDDLLLQEFFQYLDKSKDGFITAAEIRAGVKAALGEVVSHEEALVMVQECDLKGDGKVSYLEFLRIMGADPPCAGRPRNPSRASRRGRESGAASADLA